MKFNFSNLHSAFMDTIRNHQASMAFTIENGRGIFTFLLFIPSTTDGQILWKKLDVFIILGRTQKIINPSIMGYYTKGNFIFSFLPREIELIKQELDLGSQGFGFSLSGLLEALNAKIPARVSAEGTATALHNNRALVQGNCKVHLDNPDKIYLIGKVELPPQKKPRDETLRKLCFLAEDPKEVARLIKLLKKLNWTVKWTSSKPDGERFKEILRLTTSSQ